MKYFGLELGVTAITVLTRQEGSGDQLNILEKDSDI